MPILLAETALAALVSESMNAVDIGMESKAKIHLAKVILAVSADVVPPNV